MPMTWVYYVILKDSTDSYITLKNTIAVEITFEYHGK